MDGASDQAQTPGEENIADALARMRAQTDQAISGGMEVARLFAAYYRTLIEEGVDPEHARDLTLNYQYCTFMRPSE